MALAITIELDHDEVARFLEEARHVDGSHPRRSPDEILTAARRLLDPGRAHALPGYIRQRLGMLEELVAMVTDPHFALPEELRQHVLACLRYFATGPDLIPDSTPLFGYLDDAILIELASRELRHELEAWRHYVERRQEHADQLGVEPADIEDPAWSAGLRDEMIERIRHRRLQARERGERPLFKVGN